MCRCSLEQAKALPCRTRARRQNAACRMQSIRENGKNAGGESEALSLPAFSRFHCARGEACIRFLSFMRRPLVETCAHFRILGAGRFSLPWGTGDEQSPASFLRNRRKLFVCTHNHFACRVQGGTPCRRGSGAAQAPAPVSPPLKYRKFCKILVVFRPKFPHRKKREKPRKK